MLMLASSQMGISLENARLYERTERLAHFDELTGIYNRRAFFEMARGEFNKLQFEKGNLSLFIVDIDLFKRINDHLGHVAGDYVLKQVAELMGRNLRAGDSVARLGGKNLSLCYQGQTNRWPLKLPREYVLPLKMLIGRKI